ncbi:MAG: YdcF family protein [Betaproteobacteria bacterium]
MIDPIWVKALLKTLALPPTGPLLLALLGLAVRRRSPRLGAGLTWTGVLSLLALSIPAVATLLMRSLDLPAPFDRAQAAGAQAIVILGGGTRRDAPDYGGDTLNTLTLERVRYGARVARDTGLPVLVTGGSTYGGTPEAELMRDALQRELSVAVRWAEKRSRTTHENAQYSAAMLSAAGIGRVILVAHAFDMRRATAEFAASGIATVPAATGIPSRGPARVLDFMPGINGLQASYYALYEILANLVRIATP